MKITGKTIIFTASFLFLSVYGFADTGSPDAEEEEVHSLSLFHSLKIEEDKWTGRFRILSETGDPAERVDAAVTHISGGSATEVFPGIRTRHMAAGSLNPEGLLAAARTGHFAGYSASSDYTPAGITADFGLSPVHRRGMAFLFPARGGRGVENARDRDGGVYWLRDKDASETGLFYNWNTSGEKDVSLLFSRSFFGTSLEPELAAEKPRRGRGEEMLRGSAALRSGLKGAGNISLVASISALPTLPRGFFFGASYYGDKELFSWAFAGDYSGDYYIYHDGKAAAGETTVSADCTLLPGGPVGTDAGFKLRDEGGEFTPDLYRESDHEFSVGLFFLAEDCGAEIEHFRKWSWETGGDGDFEIGTDVSMKCTGEYLSADLAWKLREEGETGVGTDYSGEFGGSLRFKGGPVSLDAEGKIGMDWWVYSSQLRIDLGENAEIYARGLFENGLSEWTIGWNLEREVELTD